MKHLNKSFSTLVLSILLGAASCKKAAFLDPKAVTDLNKEVVFSDSTRTMAFLTGIYSNVGASFRSNWSGGYTAAIDECNSRYTGGTLLVNRFQQGTVTSADAIISGDPFNFALCYRRIRQANLYLANVDASPLSSARKTNTKAEARFLRAWYYAMLLKAYGGLQLVGDKVYDKDDEILVPRSSYADCVDYLVSELDAAAAVLPGSYQGLEYGRVTKGACLALKARVLLYAASPLFNGGSIATDPKLKELTAYPVADPQRWSRAADAFQAVMNLGAYSLRTDNSKPGLGFYKVFLERVNSEFIFSEMRPLNKDWESRLYPRDIAGNGSGNQYLWPLQNAVDRFGMSDGTPYNPAVSDNNPYVSRDPRFYFTIVFNGSRLFTTAGNTYQPVFTYVNNPAPNNNPQTNNAIVLDNTASGDHTKTGYYGRKMCDTTLAANSSASPERINPLMRYAEIILGYAECLNELGRTEEAVQQVAALRMRAGIIPGANNRYGIPASISQANMRKLIQNEWAVEFMFEDNRFWDVRRWKIAEQTETAEMQGMKITKTGATFTYERFKLTRQHYWPANNSYYLMPFAQSELAKLPGVLLQNPGW
jgi:hypothetical protein